MRAKPQRTQNWQEMRIAWRFSLRFSTPARYARLRGKARREALSCPCGTEGRSERERTPRNHIQRTYKGFGPRQPISLAPPLSRPITARSKQAMHDGQINGPLDIELEVAGLKCLLDNRIQPQGFPQTAEDQIRTDSLDVDRFSLA